MRLSSLIIVMLVTHSRYVKEISSCSIMLSAITNLVELGSSILLTCQICPSTTAINFNHNSSNIAFSILVTGEMGVVNKSLYNLTYETETRKLNLIIINFKRSSVGNYSCFNPYTTDISSLTLEHSVPVTFVTLTPAIPTISVLQNVPISDIKCTSSEGRPTPAITWYLDKNTPSNDTNYVNVTLNSRSETTGDVTTSTLTITPTVEDHGASLYCKVTNGYGQIISKARLFIDVLVVPSRPIILHKSVIVSDNISVILNRSVSLECNSSGYPTPTISWVLSNGSVMNNKYMELKWENRVNTDTITCRATSVMQPTYGIMTTHYNTTDLLINILYSPSIPTCSIGDKLITENAIRAIKNEPLNINCTSKSNPPPTSYSWTLPDGLKQDGQQLKIQRVLSNGPYALDVNNVMHSTFSPQVITGNANSIFTLDILCAPRSSPYLPPVPRVWTKLNSIVILTFIIVAYPPPSASSAFVWRKQHARRSAYGWLTLTPVWSYYTGSSGRHGKKKKSQQSGYLIKLLKKGDFSFCSNLRGITLLSIPGKVFKRILLKRMKDAVDLHLHDLQAFEMRD
ncbi:hemicentin-2-like [Dreissena polymorpha]|uniref:hemicentin-2-like n=1 Tax=Dreissena polymorpha TaxID=45954 RepID=UPI002265684B|nr:hemicentin-2-like [Dreissena polymorpha]